MDAYANGAALFVAATEALTAPDLDLPVPSCPGWTVSDVITHVADSLQPGAEGTEFEALDLTLHAWDVARARGYDLVYDEPTLDFLERFAEEAGDRLRTDGAFAPVPPPTGADRHERVLARYGRTR